MSIATAPDSIPVSLNYLINDDGVFYNLDHGASTLRFAPYDAVVTNARPTADRFTLERSGFVLVRHQTKVGDLLDERQIAEQYVPETEALVCALTGARRAIIFQTATRSVDGEKHGGREPVRSAHCDHPEVSYRKYAAMVLGEEEAERELRRRWMVVNVWRGIVPVETYPLAVCDASTVRTEDLTPTKTFDKPGGTMTPFFGHPLKYSPDHRWYYFPNMQPDEALIFKQFDSDQSRVKWAAHSAIVDPTSPPGAIPRSSIEARVLVIF